MARQMIKRGKHKETAENHGKMFKRGNRGETLIETLFALLVGSVSLMILATMISMSARLIRISEANTEDYTGYLNRMNDSTVAGTEKGTAEIQFFRSTDISDPDLDLESEPDANPEPDKIPVTIKSFSGGRGKLVIAYEKANSVELENLDELDNP